MRPHPQSPCSRQAPWQNGSHERFDGTFRLECLEAERVHSLVEATMVIEGWRRHDNQDRPDRALEYRIPTITEGAVESELESQDSSSPRRRKNQRTQLAVTLRSPNDATPEYGAKTIRHQRRTRDNPSDNRTMSHHPIRS
ncbi:MAG: transposase [Nitrospirales bacterium]|nr:transposase [Nitrospirales bacterium]